MTSSRRDAAASAAPPEARPLRRRASDRVIGGVAAGIADYFNVDPLLVRAAFVGLMIFGGAGLVLYVGAWLLIPVETRNDSIVEAALRRVGLAPGRALGILALIALLFWLFGQGGYIGGVYYGEPPIFLIVAIVLVGIVLLSRGGPRSTDAAHRAAAAPPATGALLPPMRAERVVVVREPRPRLPRGPLGWYALAAALVGIGLLALVDNVTDATVVPGQFFGVLLALVGIGLVIGSWWGNARLLILPAILVLPMAWAASFITVPLEGGTGDQLFAPISAQELRDEYRLVGGRLTLDLRELEAGSEPIRISASVAFGTLTVFLPPEAQLEIDSHVGAGGSSVFGSYQGGTDITERIVRGEAGPRFVLDLGAGIGYVWVEEH